MKLRKPEIRTLEFRRELDAEYSYLCDDDVAYLTFHCDPGGYLNPKLKERYSEIVLERQTLRNAMSDLPDDKRQKRGVEIDREIAEKRFEAIYTHCVKSWETNIIDADTGEPMEPTTDSFMALCAAEIPGISSVCLELSRFIENTAQFVAKAEEETEKN